MPATVVTENPEDPRYWQERVKTLEKRLKALEDKTIPYLAHQRGAVPGFMRAIQINDPKQAASMWLNLQGNLPGISPYQAVTDANNIIRAELGNLAANGNSPAQFGFRANNASGVPIFDSLGLISALTVIGSSVSPWGFNTLTGVAGPPFGITGQGGEVSLASATFSVPRQVSVFLIGSVVAAGWTTVGPIPLGTPIYIRVAGQVNSASSCVIHSLTLNTTTAATGATPLQVLTLTTSGNPYTVNMWWNSFASGNDRLDVYTTNLYAFQLGS